MLEVAAPQSATAPPPVVPPAPAEHHVTFREVLSALNPLQYLPVIGTIYRAVTGDQIPEGVRRIGSIIASGLLGGPIGIAINIASIGVEKATGIDFDQAGQALLAGHAPTGKPGDQSTPASVQTAGPDAPAESTSARTAGADTRAASPTVQTAGRETTATRAPLQTASPNTPTAPASGPAADPVAAWSPPQLAAYRVTTVADGTLRLGELSGADVLNALELSRLQMARSAYGRATALAG